MTLIPIGKLESRNTIRKKRVQETSSSQRRS